MVWISLSWPRRGYYQLQPGVSHCHWLDKNNGRQTPNSLHWIVSMIYLDIRMSPKMLLLSLLLSGLLVIHWCPFAWTLPAQSPATTISTTREETMTTAPANLPIQTDIRNYLREEQQFEALLEQLKREHNQKLALDPADYVADDIPFEELKRLIENTISEPSVTISLDPAPKATLARGGIIWTPSAGPITTTSKPEITTQSERDSECSICLGSMKATVVDVLPCKHEFHADCLRKWVEHESEHSALCPLCRGEVAHGRQTLRS